MAIHKTKRNLVRLLKGFIRDGLSIRSSFPNRYSPVEEWYRKELIKSRKELIAWGFEKDYK